MSLLNSAPYQDTDLASAQPLADRLRDPRDRLVQNSATRAGAVFSRCLICVLDVGWVRESLAQDDLVSTIWC